MTGYLNSSVLPHDMPANFTFDGASAGRFSTKLHINTGLSIASNLLAFYLIIRHSTRSIALYRWCLFDIC
ncbi:hypothetical protein AAVH_35555, partial [Aphelenchoides avenae]